MRMELDASQQRQVGLLLGAPLVIGSLFVVALGFETVAEGNASRAWPQTTAVIRNAEVIKHPGRSAATFAPSVTYSYVVSGQILASSRILVGDQEFSSFIPARNVVAKYPVESRHSVFYDPNRPARAVLEPGVRPILFRNMLLGMALGILGLSIGYGSWTAGRPRGQRIALAGGFLAFGIFLGVLAVF